MRRFIRPVPMTLGLFFASGLCSLLVSYRMMHTGHGYYRFLIWNLILAWVPFVIARVAHLRRARWPEVTVTSLLWLLFFPNAPYLFSDFVHLGRSQSMPVWFDALMLTSFGVTGALLGFGSLRLMQGVWERMAGPRVAWAVVWSTLVLSSVGIYLGRAFRLNSWDALVHPRRVVAVVLYAVEQSREDRWILGALLIGSLVLVGGYASFHAATHPDVDPRLPG